LGYKLLTPVPTPLLIRKKHLCHFIVRVILVKAKQIYHVVWQQKSGEARILPLLLLLLQRSLLPPSRSERFCVPLRLGTNWGYWPSDSVFDQESITSYSCFTLGWGLLLATGIGTRYARYKVPHFTSHSNDRRTRAIEVNQLAQGCKQTWQ
jgi:hypothetical protein